MRLFVDTCDWERVSCVDPRCLEIFKRHYTYNPLRKNVPRFVGPGEEITLLSIDGKALFVWRKEKYRNDDQTGINCAVFRNEGDVLSSVLILQAEEIAWRRWPGERLFTFVNARKVESENPGYCFKRAGWKRCGKSKKKELIILEKLCQQFN
jgi:hypothetical protein